MRLPRAFVTAALATAFLVGAGHAPQAVAGELPGDTAFFTDSESQVNKWVAANPGDSRQPRIASR
ncbi:endoglucanase 1, partial [Streptomyces sp. MCAF7]